MEAFAERGGNFLISESGGWRVIDGGEPRAYASGAANHFVGIGNDYAVMGGRDAKTLYILKRTDGAGATLAPRSPDEYSEARVTPLGHAVYYSYKGMAVRDMAGRVVGEAAFPDPTLVTDTRFDVLSGNVVVLYESALRIYSGENGALVTEAFGKAGAKSVIYTDFGVAVLSDGGVATLIDAATGETIRKADAVADADCALPLPGGVVRVAGGSVYWGERELAKGEIVGASKISEDEYAFAAHDGANGTVFRIRGANVGELFSFEAAGRGTEVYFTGGFVAADYVSTDSRRYTILLTGDTLETAACLPGYMGTAANGDLLLDGGRAGLRAVKLYGVKELMALARERLDGREFTAEEKKAFKI